MVSCRQCLSYGEKFCSRMWRRIQPRLAGRPGVTPCPRTMPLVSSRPFGTVLPKHKWLWIWAWNLTKLSYLVAITTVSLGNHRQKKNESVDEKESEATAKKNVHVCCVTDPKIIATCTVRVTFTPIHHSDPNQFYLHKLTGRLWI